MHIFGNLTLNPQVLVSIASNNKHKVAWQCTILSWPAWDQTDITR